MAAKRMFNINLVTSEDFYDISPVSRDLYYQLNFAADDDGVCNNPRTVMRMCGAKAKHYSELVENGYILEFSDKLCVITHWLIHNTLKAGRYKPTMYQNALKSLEIQGKVYQKKQGIQQDKMFDICTTDNEQTASTVKYSKDKESKDKKSKDKHSIESPPDNSGDLCRSVFDAFCETLSSKYPKYRLDKEKAFPFWKSKVDMSELDVQSASNKLGSAVLKYLIDYEKSHKSNDGTIDKSYIPYLSNLLGDKFHLLEPFWDNGNQIEQLKSEKLWPDDDDDEPALDYWSNFEGEDIE